MLKELSKNDLKRHPYLVSPTLFYDKRNHLDKEHVLRISPDQIYIKPLC